MVDDLSEDFVVYKRIVKIYESTKKPVSPWQVFEFCRHEDGLGIAIIKNSLKNLFEKGYLKWVGEGQIKPEKRWWNAFSEREYWKAIKQNLENLSFDINNKNLNQAIVDCKILLGELESLKDKKKVR